MERKLSAVGYYISPPGGSRAPRKTKKDEVFFEMITAGAVFAPEDMKLCGPGWIFVHLSDQESVSCSPPDLHYECMTVSFSPAKAQSLWAWPDRFLWENEESAVSFAHEMLFAFHHADVDREILGDFVWSQLRFRLACFLRQNSNREIPLRISAVMTYMDRHFPEPIGVNDLANHVGLSASHLYARFREFVGVTPHQYLIRQRMKSARHRLATTVAPIKAISVDVGYANTENFCRAFKRHVGIPAAAYRRKYMIYQ